MLKARLFGVKFTFIMILLFACGMPKTINAGNRGAGQGTATVTIPVVGSITEPLKFGLILPGGQSRGDGVVVVTPKNRRFTTGGVRLGRCGDFGDKDKDKDKDGDKDKDDDKDKDKDKDTDGGSGGDGNNGYQGDCSFSRAVFDLSGAPNTFFTIVLSNTPALHTGGGNGSSLQIINLKSFSVTQNFNSSMGLFDANGKETIWVGGSLQVPAQAEKGSYTGKITLTVNF